MPGKEQSARQLVGVEGGYSDGGLARPVPRRRRPRRADGGIVVAEEGSPRYVDWASQADDDADWWQAGDVEVGGRANGRAGLGRVYAEEQEGAVVEEGRRGRDVGAAEGAPRANELVDDVGLNLGGH
jgi:hypothetical protein